ncbi:transposable element Tc1 transposase [Trichonephila clavipes]|nr:transposable element Tc1 transposase [Trichonephila clavipes]
MAKCNEKTTGCRNYLNWTQLQWKQVIWSDESSCTLFQTNECVLVCRTPVEAFHVDCLVPTVKPGGSSVMVWSAIFSCELGHLVVLEGDDHRRPLSKHSRRSSSPYASNSLSG